MSGMIETKDGRHAVCLDGGRFHGWVFYRHPNGQWVSLRRALPSEIQNAQAAHEWANRHEPQRG